MSEPERADQIDPRTAWNACATAWDAHVATGADYYRTEVHMPALLSVCGIVQGQRTLDLGCGQGIFSRELAQYGARVAGVDIAEEQIQRACRHEERHPLGINYHVHNATRLTEHWAPNSFDLVTACMALHDMPDPGGALRAAHQVLRERGRCVFSIPHPLNTPPTRAWERGEAGRKLALKIDRYFESGARITHWKLGQEQRDWVTPYWHRPLSEWSTLIAEAQFFIRRIVEPHPTPQQIQQHPDLEDCSRIPYFIVFDLIKGSLSSACI